MSTYYDFMVEAKYEGKWYNIDFHTKDIDGKLRHQYLATISRSFIGLLEDRVNGAWAISFDDLAESTQQLLLASTFEGREDSLRLERFYVAGNLDDLNGCSTARTRWNTMSPATRSQLMKSKRLTKSTNT
jgi:hypothetical protein